MSSIIGNRFTLSLFGDGNEDVVGAVIEGLPVGFAPDTAKLTGEYKILSGMHKGKCTGTPLCVLFPTPTKPSLSEKTVEDVIRPGFDDLGEYKKSGGKMERRNGHHNTSLLQKAILFAGALAEQLLKEKNVHVYSHILQVGQICDQSFEGVARIEDVLPALSKGELPVMDKRKEMLMKLAITKANADGDTLGGKIEATVLGLDAGIGAPIFAGLKSRLSEMLFSLSGATALEFGKGVGAAEMCGSEYNDLPFMDTMQGKVVTKTNHCGGIEGGMSNGMPLLLTVTFAPSPVIAKFQSTVHRSEQRNVTLPPFESADSEHLKTKCALVRSAIALTIIDTLI